MSDPCFATIAEQRRALARRALSAVELAELHLERIRDFEPRVNAFTRIDPDAVLRAARAADRALARGEHAPLLGIPLVVKDIIDERGVPNTAGSALRLDAVALTDATVVTRLRSAGALLIGRTNLHEFAAGATNENETFGQTRNPHDPTRIPGGSSGGTAAAVAAGFATAGLGTDTAGSIRCPAALCGIVGLKPTYGRVSRAGVVPLSWSLDHVGPMARTVGDAATLLRIIAGSDPRDPTTADVPLGPAVRVVRRLRFSTGDPALYADVAPAVRRAVAGARRALRELGLTRVRTRIPLAAVASALQYVIGRAETAAVHLEDLAPARVRYISDDVRGRVELGLGISAVDYLQAQRARTLLRDEVDAALRTADVLVLPTTAAPAPRIGTKAARVAGRRQNLRELLIRLTLPFNLTGHPALALPAGVDEHGLPVSVQIVGRPYDEATVLAVGAALERALALTLRPSPMA